LQNFSQHTCTAEDSTIFGRSVDSPAARRLCCHRRFSARPPNMHASEDPTVEVPMVWSGSGAFHSRAIIRQQRSSISAVAGYSSLSIMFLSKASLYSRFAWSSIHVPTKVARFIRALPSSIASSWMSW
jgi:hypothetical protein